MELPAMGPALYLVSFTLLAIPLILFLIDYLRPKQLSIGKKLPIPPPTKIVEIRIYPIKSCRGFQVQSARLLKNGMDLDRQWMFVEADTKHFVTIRQISKMTLIDTAINEKEELEVSIRQANPPVRFNIAARPSKDWLEKNTELSEVEIWGQKLDGYMYPKSLTQPIADFLEKDVRLVYKGPKVRVLGGNGAPSLLGRTESMKFADLMPLQVSNRKSIDELNGRLSQIGHAAISIERFRPNLVVEGESPWYEDSWKTVRIEGKDGRAITSDVVARCARCQVPNVDPDTAEKDRQQPWDTLWKYRRVDEGIKFKPCFGMLCVPREEGEVRIGDSFVITEVTEHHKYLKST